MNIRAPMSTFSGRIGGVEFTRGNATADLTEEQVAWFRARGYTVTEEPAEAALETPSSGESADTDGASDGATAPQPAPATHTTDTADQPATNDGSTDEAATAPVRRAARRSSSSEDND